MVRSLSNCEKEIMDAIYAAGKEMNLEEIRDEVNKKYDSAHRWSIQMIATFTARLMMRKLIIGDSQGKFKPEYTKEKYQEIVNGEE